MQSSALATGSLEQPLGVRDAILSSPTRRTCPSPPAFPPWNLLIALVGTVVLALVVLALPLRRAVRLRPGDALRYG